MEWEYECANGWCCDDGDVDVDCDVCVYVLGGDVAVEWDVCVCDGDVDVDCVAVDIVRDSSVSDASCGESGDNQICA